MSDSSLPLPKYSIWQSINVAISLAMRAIEEIRIVANRPPPRDGYGFDDMSCEYDGERRVTLRFTRGDQVKEFPIDFPVVLYRGVYKDNDPYKRGDSVTWGGSLYIAQEDTDKHPRDSKGTFWKLAVKAGRDGRNM